MTTMPMHPTLLRTTYQQSLNERFARYVRGELAVMNLRQKHLREILNVSPRRSSGLYWGRMPYTLREVEQIGYSIDLRPFNLLNPAQRHDHE